MSIRMRRQATDRLALSQGDSLIVKRHLTAGEYRGLLRAAIKPLPVTAGARDEIELDPIAASEALVVAYLLDWKFADADGRQIVNRRSAAGDRAGRARPRSTATPTGSAAGDSRPSGGARPRRSAEEKKHAPGVTSPDRILTSVE